MSIDFVLIRRYYEQDKEFDCLHNLIDNFFGLAVDFPLLITDPPFSPIYLGDCMYMDRRQPCQEFSILQPLHSPDSSHCLACNRRCNRRAHHCNAHFDLLQDEDQIHVR